MNTKKNGTYPWSFVTWITLDKSCPDVYHITAAMHIIKESPSSTIQLCVLILSLWTSMQGFRNPLSFFMKMTFSTYM